jgi:hypothetical protein
MEKLEEVENFGAGFGLRVVGFESLRVKEF